MLLFLLVAPQLCGGSAPIMETIHYYHITDFYHIAVSMRNRKTVRHSFQCEYLLHTPDQKHFDYRNYYDSYFTPLMEQLGYDQTPHCTRHTCISMLTEAHVDQTMIKKIVGHSGAMTLTERVYTHLDIETLVEAINKI